MFESAIIIASKEAPVTMTKGGEAAPSMAATLAEVLDEAGRRKLSRDELAEGMVARADGRFSRAEVDTYLDEVIL